LHAAGIYSGPGQDCLSNYVVSSYTPTLSALINARNEREQLNQGHGADTLLVCVPETSGLSSLPSARLEATVIEEILPSIGLTALTDDKAIVSNVLEKLPSVGILHLACHGHQSQDNPLSSGFSLHDGRLRLEQLMQLHMPQAQLAYLSACETASTDEYQPDEVINLAATMLFVGFKSVIATMWYVLSVWVRDLVAECHDQVDE
jgi:CHAT domain-containing protein